MPLTFACSELNLALAVLEGHFHVGEKAYVETVTVLSSHCPDGGMCVCRIAQYSGESFDTRNDRQFCLLGTMHGAGQLHVFL